MQVRSWVGGTCCVGLGFLHVGFQQKFTYNGETHVTKGELGQQMRKPMNTRASAQRNLRTDLLHLCSRLTRR